MTGKEALDNLTKGIYCPPNCNNCDKCEKNESIKAIKKDLEVLEILKKHTYSSDDSLSILMDDLRCEEDFNKVKEWLNEKTD